MKRLRSLACRLRGHRWEDRELRYREGVTRALIGAARDRESKYHTVPVTWVCDEVCGRCGCESWWPT